MNTLNRKKTALFLFGFFGLFSCITTTAQGPRSTYQFSGTTYRVHSGTFPVDILTPGMTVVIRIFKKYENGQHVLITELTGVSGADGRLTLNIPCFPPVGQDQFSTAFHAGALNVDGTVTMGPYKDTLWCHEQWPRWGGAIRSANPFLGNSQNAGPTFSYQSVGCPINTATGNMWVEQTDHVVPGIGENQSVRRTYNSTVQSKGLLGIGWTSNFDISLLEPGADYIQLRMPSGQSFMFRRLNNQYFSTNLNFFGSLIKNGDETFTVNFYDGRIYQFGENGKPIWLKDKNGNQTTYNYNSEGQLTGITDPFNRALSVIYTAAGYIASVSDSSGVIATYSYHPNLCSGDTSCEPLSSVAYPDGSKYEFEYLVQDNKVYLTFVKDAIGNVLEEHEYDSLGRATTSEKHGGIERYTLDYSNWTNLTPFTQVTDALGRVSKYYFETYGSRNLVTKTEGACSCGGNGSEVVQYIYDPSSNLVKLIDALGRETTYTYDSNGNRLTETDVLGTKKWTYNQFGQVLTYKDRVHSQSSDPNVNTVVNTYSSSGNLLTTKDALNNTTTLTYTTIGQLSTVTDARNKTTTLSWDAQGRLSQVTDANNKNTNFAYDTRARITGLTNALSQTTNFEYDLNNRLKKVIYPDTNFVENTYDLAGRRTTFRDARGNVTNFSYDGANRLTGITDPLGNSTTYGYDLMSNLVSQTDGLGNVTNLEYDDFDRLKKVIYPPASTGATRLEESLTYDLNGNVKTRVDTAGRTTSYDYDISNRLIMITDALLNQTQFEYNLRSQMTKVKDALNQEYIYTYDPLGRALTQTRAGATMSFEYDAVGNRTKRTDYRGRESNYTYDNLNRLTQISYPMGNGNQAPARTSNYTYDDLSRLVSAMNDAGTVAFTYDNRGRLKTETDVFGHVTERAYDANSNRTQLKLDGNVHTGYAYDAANRLTTLTDDASQNFTYGYDIADRLISNVLPNGITSTFEYDGMSQLKKLKHQSASATLTENDFTYNTANQIGQIAELAQTKNFAYDNVDRLTGMTNGTANESYAFDAVGNRMTSHLSANYAHQPFNKLTATAMISMA